jgi:major membrane immunogen (membrane-anchored lipoprotein)
MKKLLIPMVLMIGLLTACGETEPPQPVGQIVEATIVEKKEQTFVDEYDDKYIKLTVTVEKNGQKLNFFVDDATYSVVSKGVVINGEYFADGYLGGVTFPKLLDKPIDKSNE